MIQLEKILASPATAFVLLTLYAAGLAAATFLEKAYGTALARVAIYCSPLFFLLQALLVVNFVAMALKRRLLKSRRLGLPAVHLAFIVILAGALVTHLFGREGTLHLREGQAGGQMEMHTARGHTVHELPFRMELVKFTLTRYPGSASPSSFESDVRVYVDGDTLSRVIFMNNVLDVKGYRFFQASFDADERGSVLTVNRDVAGRNITYAGYLLLLAGCIACLTEKNGRVRTLYRQLHVHRRDAALLTVAGLLAFSPFAGAQTGDGSVTEAVQQHAVDPAHAKRFGALPLQSPNGRIMPVNTFSSEILRKLYRKARFGSLEADGFLLGVLAMPEMWMHVPLIAVPNRELAARFGLTDGHCSYMDVFDGDGNYRLQHGVEEAYRKMPAGRDAMEKELIKLDERINIFHQLLNGQLLNLFPGGDGLPGKWYAPGDDLSVYGGQDSMFVSQIFGWYLSDVREAIRSGDWRRADEILDMISAYQQSRGRASGIGTAEDRTALEVAYNRLEVFRRCKTGYLALGGLLLVGSFVRLYRARRRWTGWLVCLPTAGILAVFLFHMLGMGLRWHIGGHAPWSNSYETMVYVAWATVFGGLVFVRRSPVTLALATLFAGVILFVSGLNWMDPQISPLAPVLKSPWLMFHVAVLMAAYGFFGISFFLGLTNLITMSLVRKSRLSLHAPQLRERSTVNELSLLAGLVLMTVGTFMGAVWANESWGRYWGWDPKETWALITIVVYVLVTHLHLIPKLYSLWLLNLLSVVAFASVLMTYFGVNYFLSGMHSYGQSDAASGISGYLYAAAALVTALALGARKGSALRMS
ncbi:MAG: cytochrome c biogenesis protein CcsA [Tannerella sp.]|jgi:cytochrome c-type biogenesis protein CcsB|nr:cytochrome c biogenesis protein CcsA [Tannerella sp.]